MPQRELERDTSAEAVSVDIAPVEAEHVEQRSNIVGELLVGEATLDVGGVPMALELDGDHLMVSGESRDEISHQLHRHERAGQEHEWRAGAVAFVVHLEP